MLNYFLFTYPISGVVDIQNLILMVQDIFGYEYRNNGTAQK